MTPADRYLPAIFSAASTRREDRALALHSRALSVELLRETAEASALADVTRHALEEELTTLAIGLQAAAGHSLAEALVIERVRVQVELDTQRISAFALRSRNPGR